MAHRRKYFVSPEGDRWRIQDVGAQQSLGEFDTKEAAVRRAREIAQGEPPSQVVIQKRDGQIETEHTYGDDPRRFEG
jgi:hypothetical protein